MNILVATSLDQFYEDGAVVTLNLWLGLLLIGCKDNLDLLALSTTGGGSFHGTTISLMQQPTKGENLTLILRLLLKLQIEYHGFWPAPRENNDA